MKACLVHPANMERVNQFNQKLVELKSKKVNKIIQNKSQLNLKNKRIPSALMSDRLRVTNTSYSAYSRNKVMHNQNAASMHVASKIGLNPVIDNSKKLIISPAAITWNNNTNNSKSMPYLNPATKSN